MENAAQFSTPAELSPAQRAHWEQRLRDIEVAREYALRMLGRTATLYCVTPE